ncbi:PhoH family protein [Legionella spiritensis]|uniref:PhoH family protein n=1 Tax=Legionella spiritensis TaxID=452 RepID=UPI000F71CE15|nr:PhoH family protein [Legionella spiritensis]VEG90028.1 phosphate starvation-inducible protein PhoH [Legionella spiritensis]
MSSTLQSKQVSLPDLSADRLANICGALHENITLLERHFKLTVTVSNDHIHLCGGASQSLSKAEQIIRQLYLFSDNPITRETLLPLINDEEPQAAMNHPVKLTRKTIRPKNSTQAAYLDSISQHDITFAIGPAGTGKTYLAVSKAIESFEKGEVQKLVFVRPAVEAGEKLGFLPGDLVDKVLPFLRPIYDALYEMIGYKESQKLIQSDVIEILPLAFMRGRTLNEAFIILDEAQNTTMMQMQMFLTRMGFGSKTVITGDITQIDLPKGIHSGLVHAVKILSGIENIAIHTFSSREVVRHPLVSRIIDCYEAHSRDNKK